LKEVHDPERFGVATLDPQNKVTKIVEKPKEPETNYAVTGLYLYTPHVFGLVPKLKPSRRNELEITDINNHYVKKGTMKAKLLDGYWSDMGLPHSAKQVQDHLWESQNALLQE
jgi:glucose-1-phosphate thymidylyltransferase